MRASGLAAALGLSIASAVVFVLARQAPAADIALWSSTTITLWGFGVLALTGAALQLSRRTQFVGTLLLAVPAAGVIHLGVWALISRSATVSALVYNAPHFDLFVTGASIGFALLVGAVAVALAPAPAHRSSKGSPS